MLSPIWFPALVFLLGSLTSFATGTSWGTMAILIPTAVPIAFELDGATYGLTTVMSLGAVLDGATWGNNPTGQVDVSQAGDSSQMIPVREWLARHGPT